MIFPFKQRVMFWAHDSTSVCTCGVLYRSKFIMGLIMKKFKKLYLINILQNMTKSKFELLKKWKCFPCL